MRAAAMLPPADWPETDMRGTVSEEAAAPHGDPVTQLWFHKVASKPDAAAMLAHTIATQRVRA